MSPGQLVSGTVLMSIGERLRAARERAGYTLEELAALTGLSKAHLSRLESAERQPSIAALLTFASALRVPVGRLLGDEADETAPPMAVYSPHALPHEVAGLHVAPCSGYTGSGALEALRMTISPDREPGPLARHRGEEWLYVVSGELELDYDGRAYEILSGSPAHFDADRPHRLRAKDQPTEVLVVAAQGPTGLWSSHRWGPEKNPGREKNLGQEPGHRKPNKNGGAAMTMTADKMAQIEGTGKSYELVKLLQVRSRTRHAVYKIAEGLSAGMVEEDARAMARDVLKAMGMRRGWHHIITRLGPNTTKDFMASSEPGIVLQPDDIFFIDIGPIYGDTEGDAGETFVVGDDPEHRKAKSDVRAIWEDVRSVWFSTGATGEELYDYARQAAHQRGWKLNMDLSGHRLSDFPHSAHYDGSLADVAFRPNPNLWVLEIAIAHPERQFGAFYEDLLLEDQSFPSWALSAAGVAGE